MHSTAQQFLQAASESAPRFSGPGVAAHLETGSGIAARSGPLAAASRSHSYIQLLEHPAGSAPLPEPGNSWSTAPSQANAAKVNTAGAQLNRSQSQHVQHGALHSRRHQSSAAIGAQDSPDWHTLQSPELQTVAVPSQFQHLLQSRDAERSHIESKLKNLHSFSSNRAGGDMSSRSPDSVPVSAATTPRQSRLSQAISSNGGLLAVQPQFRQPQQEQQPMLSAQHVLGSSGVGHTESGIAAAHRQSVQMVQSIEMVKSGTAIIHPAGQQAQPHLQQQVLQQVDRSPECGSTLTPVRSLAAHKGLTVRLQQSLNSKLASEAVNKAALQDRQAPLTLHRQPAARPNSSEWPPPQNSSNSC